MSPSQTPSVSYQQGAIMADLGNQVVISLLRPHDLANLLLHFSGFSLDRATNTFARAEDEAYLAVWFPPQSIIEKAFFQEDDDPGNPQNEPVTGFPVQHRMSKLSRLVFKIPEEITLIPNTVEALLDWSKLEPCINNRGLSSKELPPFVIIGKPFKILPQLFKRKEIIERNRPDRILSDATRLTQSDEWQIFTVSSGSTPTLSVGLSSFLPAEDFIFPIINPDKYKKPGPHDTFIEAPYRLLISPNEKQRWAHATEAVSGKDDQPVPEEKTDKETYELWHTRIADKDKDGKLIDADKTNPIPFRALWSPDADLDPQKPPVTDFPNFRTSLQASDRHKLVHETSNYDIDNYHPKPFEAWQFMMTALGAYMNVKGSWEVEQLLNLNLEQWLHRSTLGRDHYVRVVYAGYLYPFGNRASLVKITERKIRNDVEGKGPMAINFQRYFIIVREPFKTFPAFADQNKSLAGAHADKYRRIPLKNVFIENVRTPNISDPDPVVGPSADLGQAAFWIRVGGENFPFLFKARDLENRELAFQAPLLFVGQGLANDPAKANLREDVLDAYRDDNAIALSRQTLAIAPALESGRTSFETSSLKFESIENSHDGFPLFFPVLQEAGIYATPINNLLGDDKHITTVLPFYKPNDGNIFASLKSANLLNFTDAGDKSGGIANPNLNLGALSETLGPVGGEKLTNVADLLDSPIASGKFNPQDFFNNALPTLFGVIKLTDLLPLETPLPADAGSLSSVAPKLVQDVIKNKEVVTSYTWTPELQYFELPGVFTFDPRDPLFLKTEIRVPLDPGGSDAPQTSLEGKLTNFDISLFSIIGLGFDVLSFKSVNGKKPDLNCEIRDGSMEFLGFLSFLNSFKDIIPSDGFSDPPFLDLSPTGITVGYTQAIPSISVGVFSLKNIKLGAALSLPLLGGKPLTFTFNFCERYDPFNLTIYIFGGGGFFGLSVNTKGLEKVEASLEFGASFSFDIGIASGGVYAFVGMYFSMTTTNGDSEIFFQGYFRMGGSLSILGLITLSLTFKMSLNYEISKDVMWGEATLEVKVEIAFFSKTVSLHTRREIKGSSSSASKAFSGDTATLRGPTDDTYRFTDAMDLETWKSYAQAFA